MDIYNTQKRTDEAFHLVDTTRDAVATDADLLYFTAHLYEHIDSKTDAQAAVEKTLQMAMKQEPDHPGVNNDLGYTWADEGKNLAQAEDLIRKAVHAEPDNGAYLDSLGWVLYKRGQFAEARTNLEKAIEPEATADPIVLNHLGDTLYRLNASADAQHRWTESMDRLKQREADVAAGATLDHELATLKLKLQQKLNQAQSGQPVDVAPIGGADEKQATSD